MGNFNKRKILRPKNTSSNFLKFERSLLSGPTLKTRKNTIRNQFQQQWFNVISFQKRRRVYPAIWYNFNRLLTRKVDFSCQLLPSALVTSDCQRAKPCNKYASPGYLKAPRSFYFRYFRGQFSIITQNIILPTQKPMMGSWPTGLLVVTSP